MKHDIKGLNEECGVFGVFNVKNASKLTYYGLHALQHRGQEGCGIVSFDTDQLYHHKGLGLVQEVFGEQNLEKLVGDSAIGHVRYSTAGSNSFENIQPFVFHSYNSSFAMCHNGNIVNTVELKKELLLCGSLFNSTSDSEIVAHLIRQQKGDTIQCIKQALNKLQGAFAFVFIDENNLYAMRDRWGFRALSIASLDSGYIVSSETCAFDLVGANFVRDIKPGEIVVINGDGISSYFYSDNCSYNVCAMEYIYFSRPDTNIEQINVHATRKKAGQILALVDNVKADLVVGVPDSSISAAIGYAEASKIPYEMALIKNKYIGRTFIAPSQSLREKGVKLKLSAVASLVNNKRVIMVDDSIVRGTTCKRIVELLKNAGAIEVHVRIASPPIIAPCFYGVDTSTYEELISARLDKDALALEIGATSLDFLNVDQVINAVNSTSNSCGLCVACFNKNYPTKLFDKLENANKEK